MTLKPKVTKNDNSQIINIEINEVNYNDNIKSSMNANINSFYISNIIINDGIYNDSDLENTIIFKGNFTNNIIISSNIQGGNFTNCVFINCDIEAAEINHCDIKLNSINIAENCRILGVVYDNDMINDNNIFLFKRKYTIHSIKKLQEKTKQFIYNNYKIDIMTNKDPLNLYINKVEELSNNINNLENKIINEFENINKLFENSENNKNKVIFTEILN